MPIAELLVKTPRSPAGSREEASINERTPHVLAPRRDRGDRLLAVRRARRVGRGADADPDPLPARLAIRRAGGALPAAGGEGLLQAGGTGRRRRRGKRLRGH